MAASIEHAKNRVTFGRRLAERQAIQYIFQSPYSSLNPRKTIESIVSLPLKVHKIGDAAAQKRRVEEVLDARLKHLEDSHG